MKTLIVILSLLSAGAIAADREALLEGCSSIPDAEKRAKCFEALARMPPQSITPAVEYQSSESIAAQCEYETEMATPGSTGGARLGVSISQDIAAGIRRAELMQKCIHAKQTQQRAAPRGPILSIAAPGPTDHWIASRPEKLYYHPSCAEATRVSGANRQVFITEQTAEERGYRRSTAPGC